MRRIGHAAYVNRSQKTHPIHTQYQCAWNDYTALIKATKRKHWESWLEGVTKDNVWTANNLVTGPPTDGSKARVPDLQTKDANGLPRMVRDNAEKGKLLYRAFFPPPGTANTQPQEPNYPPPAFEFREVSDEQIHRAIAKLSLYKAPGPSGIPNAVITNCWDILAPFLGPIDIQGDIHARRIPHSMESNIYNCPPQTGKTGLLTGQGIPPNSTRGVPGQGTFVMHCRNPCTPKHTPPSAASNSLWGTTRLISDRLPTPCG